MQNANDNNEQLNISPALANSRGQIQATLKAISALEGAVKKCQTQSKELIPLLEASLKADPNPQRLETLSKARTWEKDYAETLIQLKDERATALSDDAEMNPVTDDSIKHYRAAQVALEARYNQVSTLIDTLKKEQNKSLER